MSKPKSAATRKFKTEGRVPNFHENEKKSTSVYKFKSASGVWLFNSKDVTSTKINYYSGTATSVDFSWQMDKLLKCIIFHLTNKHVCAKTDGAAAMKGIKYNIVDKCL
jgi:hypothetical protein